MKDPCCERGGCGGRLRFAGPCPVHLHLIVYTALPGSIPLSFGPAVPGALHNPTLGEERGEDTCNDVGRGQTIRHSLVCDFIEYVLLSFIVNTIVTHTPAAATDPSNTSMVAAPTWHDRQCGRILLGVEPAQRGAHRTPAHQSPSSICGLFGYPHCSAVSPPHHHSRLHLPSPITCTS